MQVFEKNPSAETKYEHSKKLINRLHDLPNIYSNTESTLLYTSQRVRQKLFKPVVILLNWMHVSPDILSFLSVLLGVGFLLTVNIGAPNQGISSVSLLFLFCSVLFDGLDGVLARSSNRATAKGSFTDMFCDQLVVTFTCAGLVYQSIISPVLAILFTYAYASLAFFLFIHHLLEVSTQWIIRPSRMVFFVFIAFYFFTGNNWLNIILVIYLIAYAFLSFSYFRLRHYM